MNQTFGNNWLVYNETFRRHRIRLFIFVLLLSMSLARANAQYTCILLPEPAGTTSSWAEAISGNSVVGNLSDPSADLAIYWNISNLASITDLVLNNSGSALGVYGTNVVGADASSYACIWAGFTQTDLNAQNNDGSGAWDINSLGQIVGNDNVSQVNVDEATFWPSSSSNELSLPRPTTSVGRYNGTYSYSLNEAGTRVVGDAQYNPHGGGSGSGHAVLWSVTFDKVHNIYAFSAYDINPSNTMGPTFANSIAYKTRGNYAVGEGTPNNGSAVHAILWNVTTPSTASMSYTDLHPTGFNWSEAYGLIGSSSSPKEVGWGQQTSSGQTHALLWYGTASNPTDLNSFVPTKYSGSLARDIDTTSGVIVGNVIDASGYYHAAIWVPAQ